jgi:hypothetical protein
LFCFFDHFFPLESLLWVGTLSLASSLRAPTRNLNLVIAGLTRNLMRSDFSKTTTKIKTIITTKWETATTRQLHSKGKSFISFWIAAGDCPVGEHPRNDGHCHDYDHDKMENGIEGFLLVHLVADWQTAII